MPDTQVTVTIENLAPEAGTFLTPFWVGFHDGDFDVYDRGRPISPGLERLVEDGDTSFFSEEFLISGDGSVDGTLVGPDGIGGPIDPGEVTTATFTLDSNADNSRFFSYASMVIPSNDAFVANGNEGAFQIFDDEGNFIGADFIITGSQVLDGGSEVNDELATTTAFFGQTEPDTGEAENGVVTSHPGFIEGGRILSEDGSTEGAPAAFNNADFTTDGYQVARVTVSLGERSEEVPAPPLPVADPVNITSTLDAAQEVAGGDEDASGVSTLTLNNTGTSLEYSLTVTGLDFGANGLIEGGATTEDTSDDVTRLHIHNAARGENGPIAFSLFDIVTPELGNALEIQGNQDEDLTVTANEDGSVTLTGAWEESDPAAIALSEFVPEIRNAGVPTDIDLYWNIHTEEFPGGAIRGQLETIEVAPPEPELIEVTVTIENLAPEAGTFLTPFWVGFHDGDFDVYDRGRPISPGLERLVEDGDTAPFSEEFLLSGDGSVDGTILGPEGIGGPVDPGETITATFTIDANADTSQFFSYASMVIPSNDAFIANGNPLAHGLFDDNGNFVGVDFTVLGSQVLDGGTEVNDELVETTAFFSQSEPDTGEVENGVVTIHPGFIEGGRILSEDGTGENAPAAFNNADFTAEGYEVARITVALADAPEVADPVNIISTLDAAQELAGGDEDASGISNLTLNDTGDTLEFSLTVSGLDFGANGLIEGGAITEDTSDDVTRIHIHNAARGENGPIAFSIFDVVTPELGNVLEIQGNQDEDLTVTANDDGSVTLTGAWEESDPAAIALSEFVDEIRETGSGEDIDLYWNIHTEEFPGGAIRGQLEVAEAPQPETIDLFRFRNTNFETGAYVFVGAEERDAILANPDFNQTFALDGVQEDGSITPAFTASTVAGEDLIPFFRLESLALDTLGTFLFVSTEELNAIFAEGSDQADQWVRQGFDENGEDIPEFFLFDGVADRGDDFNRFQNNQNNTFLFAGPEESAAIANDPNLANIFTNQGVAFESL